MVKMGFSDRFLLEKVIRLLKSSVKFYDEKSVLVVTLISGKGINKHVDTLKTPLPIWERADGFLPIETTT
jgi:hypothetical protein